MLRRLGFWVVCIGVAAQALAAADKPAMLSGYVRNAAGTPQMGAVVEVLGASMLEIHALTDERGFFRLPNLLPGTYSVKVTAPSFLPTLREHVGIREGSATVLNLTLNTIFETLDLGPPRAGSDDDDWKWTLRSVASRPVLRALPDGTDIVISPAERNDDHELKATLALVGGVRKLVQDHPQLLRAESDGAGGEQHLGR